MRNQQTLRVIVLRLSALGDVAMTIPVLWSLARQYPSVEVVLVSRKFAMGLTKFLPSVRFVEFDPVGKHKGFFGFYKLYRELKRMGPWDGVVDLHDVIRTKLIRFLFGIGRTKVSYIDKGRRDKKQLTRRTNKALRPLKHTVICYAETFYRLGYGLKIDVNFKGLFNGPVPMDYDILELIQSSPSEKWIGIAPFAKHIGKSYPFEKMQEVIRELATIPSVTLILFGAKGSEQDALNRIAGQYTNVKCLAGLLSIDKELEVMSNLQLMISMDSANMHLASLAGVPVVSIWGATHPYVGFYGWGQPADNAVQIDLYCRPCSVFGDKPCYRGDYACLNSIEPHRVAKEVVRILNHN